MAGTIVQWRRGRIFGRIVVFPVVRSKRSLRNVIRDIDHMRHCKSKHYLMHLHVSRVCTPLPAAPIPNQARSARVGTARIDPRLVRMEIPKINCLYVPRTIIEDNCYQSRTASSCRIRLHCLMLMLKLVHSGHHQSSDASPCFGASIYGLACQNESPIMSTCST